MKIVLTAFLAAALLVSTSVVAQPTGGSGDEARGYAVARLCGTIPANQQVDVLVLDNSDVNLRIKDAFVAALSRQNVRLQAGAPLTMTLDIQPVREYRQGSKRGDLFELRIGQADRDAGEQGDVNLRGNVWSSSRDSLVGGRTRGPSSLAVNQVRVTALLNSRVDGHCLWQAEAVHELEDRDLEEVAKQLVPVLADRYGKTVPASPLHLVPETRIR
jgi:hypothetical protein